MSVEESKLGTHRVADKVRKNEENQTKISWNTCSSLQSTKRTGSSTRRRQQHQFHKREGSGKWQREDQDESRQSEGMHGFDKGSVH